MYNKFVALLCIVVITAADHIFLDDDDNHKSTAPHRTPSTVEPINSHHQDEIFITTEAPPGIVCSTCVTFVGSIANQAMNKTFAMNFAVERACDMLTNNQFFMSSICKKLTAAQLQKLISWLKEHETMERICTKLQLC